MSIPEYKVTPPIAIHSFFSAFEAYYPPDFSFAGESHDFWEMVYVIDGKLGVSADRRVYTLSKNEIVFHKPMEFHRLWSHGGTSPRLLICSFTASGDMLKMFERGVFRLEPEQKSALFSLISFLRGTFSYAPDRQFNYFLTELAASPDSAKLLHIMANKLELFLSSMDDKATQLTNLDDRESTVYKTAVRIMEELITENPSVSAIADKCLVSESYLKNIFSKYAGIGIHKYFLRMKINHASALLRNGYSVSDVSERFSFNTQNYFSTVFKRETGISPSDYKRKNT